MENWQVALLTVGALLAGLLVPSLWHLRESLRRFAAIGEKLEPVVDDVGATARRLNRITEGFEGREHTVVDLAEAMGELAASMNRLRDTTRTATAVGAAVAAAVRAFRDVRADEEARAYEPETETATEADVADAEPGTGDAPRTHAAEGGNGHARMQEEHHEEASS